MTKQDEESRINCSKENRCFELANEFARVKIEIDKSAKGPRLKITTTRLGSVIYLDPIQLEALTWQDSKMFTELLKTPFGPAYD